MKDSSVIEISDKLGFSTNVRFDSGSAQEHYVRKELGFSIVFTHESKFLSRPNVPFRDGDAFLTGAFFYNEGVNGYKQFKGELLGGLRINSNRYDFESALGKPNLKKKNPLGGEFIKFERWDKLCDYYIHLSYFDDSDNVSAISIQMPQA